MAKHQRRNRKKPNVRKKKHRKRHRQEGQSNKNIQRMQGNVDIQARRKYSILEFRNMIGDVSEENLLWIIRTLNEFKVANLTVDIEQSTISGRVVDILAVPFYMGLVEDEKPEMTVMRKMTLSEVCKMINISEAKYLESIQNLNDLGILNAKITEDGYVMGFIRK